MRATLTRAASTTGTGDQAADAFPEQIQVIDSHTEGEPTRVVVAGWPQPRGATMSERRDDVQRHWDVLRRAVVCEPRGHDAVVGALLTPPIDAGSIAGVIFFNNVGYLGMCGHGLIGVVRTLVHLGRLQTGAARIDTPVGTVGVQNEPDGSVTIRNVPARVHALDVSVETPGYGRVTGDVAWGGNWFFVTELAALSLSIANRDALLQATRSIQSALAESGVTGAAGAVIDHVELTGAAQRADADARNFVLCPGGVYDRSPCGTGTSAKMAILHARGQLAPNAPWRQESITGGLFTGWLAEH
ncbi:MAG: proline racemase family protein, partial [Longimicrobiales bacterium]